MMGGPAFILMGSTAVEKKEIKNGFLQGRREIDDRRDRNFMERS